jgi:pentatricopeptide repeat protein
VAAEMAPGTVQLNIFARNKKLKKCVKDGQPEKAMQLFQWMQQEGMSPDKFTFVQVIDSCVGLRNVCKMWEHGGCSERAQQDAITWCSPLECHNIGICEMWAKVEGTGTILTNAIGRCPARLCYFCAGCWKHVQLHMKSICQICYCPIEGSILVHLHDEKLRWSL